MAKYAPVRTKAEALALGRKMIDLMQEGYSAHAAGIQVGITPQLMTKYKDKWPDFVDLLDEGNAHRLAYWETSLMDNAAGKIQYGKPNATIFALSNHNWEHNPYTQAPKSKVTIEQTGTNSGKAITLNLSVVPDAEMDLDDDE